MSWLTITEHAQSNDTKQIKGAEFTDQVTTLGALHCFTPVAIKSLLFVRELGRHIARVTGEVKSTNYLVQRLSVAVQRGNSAAVLGTMGHDAVANFGG